MKEIYMKRQVPIRWFYDTSDCQYTNEDGSHEHRLFYPTNFTATELDVYTQNFFIASIPNYVPKYNQTELTVNSYRVYYKPYSVWAQNCTRYTTEEIAVMGY